MLPPASAAAEDSTWPSALALDSGACDVWFVFQDQARDAALLDRYRQLLTDHERSGEGRFHFPEDRHRYLLTRALVRTVLSLYAPIGPTGWSFHVNAQGRPRIANEATSAAGLSFNVSHTRGLVMMGVSRHGTVGVDAENVRKSVVSMAMAEQFCSPEEIAALRNEPDDARRTERLLEIWTLKEAYVKARGVGLSMPLTKISVSLPGTRGIEIAFDGSIRDRAEEWTFWMLRPSPDHPAAVCVAKSGGTVPVLTVRSATPLVTHRILPTVISRQSG